MKQPRARNGYSRTYAAAIDVGDKTGIDFPTTANVPIQHEIGEKSI